jgi:hypothetical protein
VNGLPDRPTEKSGLPERRLSNRDFEMVIRRAAELQARESEGFGGEGITEAEALRIGRELGLSTQHLHRALAETGGMPVGEAGVMDRLFGSNVVRAARAVPGEAENVARLLERYFVEREYLVVQRRFADRVVFTRATGVAAAMGRATSQIFSRSPLLSVGTLELSVHPFEEGFTFVGLATSLATQRNAAAASSIVGGGTGAAATGAVLGILVAPPAALLALPILGASIYGARAYLEGSARKVQVQLESILDRVEHGDLPPPARGWAAPRRGP